MNHQQNCFDIEIVLKGCLMYSFTESSEKNPASKELGDSEAEIGNINKQ